MTPSGPYLRPRQILLNHLGLRQGPLGVISPAPAYAFSPLSLRRWRGSLLSMTPSGP